MRIKSESELLDPAIRKTILEEIKSGENQARKAESFRRYQCLKDQTSGYTVEQLKKQFDQSTINEMSYAIANISLVRKCIDKLAKVYSYGVHRKIASDSRKDDKNTNTLQLLAKELNLNNQMKQANKYLKLQRNCMVYVKPCPSATGWDIKIQPLNPHLYDVVEHFYDRTKPMCVILSDYKVQTTQYASSEAASSLRTTSLLPVGINKGDNKDQIIADTPSDADNQEFIWWTDNYHFTTDQNGEIISDKENIANPIKELPFENLAVDQDEQFWAIGGGDLVDGAILINSVITHNQHIATTQGYGQFWMRGKNVPTGIKVGPSKVIRMEYAEGDPTPEIGFASSSPALDSLRGMVEQYIALLLTTNNLSTSAVAAQLTGGMNAASGIALVIDKSESIEDVNEQREVFVQAEPGIWRKTAKFMNVLGSNLKPSLQKLRIDPALAEKIETKYNEPPSIQSEQEKLTNIKLRKDLGINTQIDLIIKDNPDMTHEEAEAKLLEILEEKIKLKLSTTEETTDGDSLDGNDEEQDDEKRNLGNPGSVGGAKGDTEEPKE